MVNGRGGIIAIEYIHTLSRAMGMDDVCGSPQMHFASWHPAPGAIDMGGTRTLGGGSGGRD